MTKIYMISDAAKEVCVENHVLRYWEEELQLPIQRNKSGQRYYTEEDVKALKQIKNMKDRGLQLKAIKLLLKNGKITPIYSQHMETSDVSEKQEQTKKVQQERNSTTTLCAKTPEVEESRQQKVEKLQQVLREMMKNAVKESNAQLCRDIKEVVLKELDYQFRLQEEREEAREERREKRDEQYYRKMDELLRIKSTEAKEEKGKKRRRFFV